MSPSTCENVNIMTFIYWRYREVPMGKLIDVTRIPERTATTAYSSSSNYAHYAFAYCRRNSFQKNCYANNFLNRVLHGQQLYLQCDDVSLCPFSRLLPIPCCPTALSTISNVYYLCLLNMIGVIVHKVSEKCVRLSECASE